MAHLFLLRKNANYAEIHIYCSIYLALTSTDQQSLEAQQSRVFAKTYLKGSVAEQGTMRKFPASVSTLLSRNLGRNKGPKPGTHLGVGLGFYLLLLSFFRN